MKSFILMLAVVVATSALAEIVTHEKFYRANGGEVLVQGGVNFTHVSYKIDFDDSSFDDSDDESSQTDFQILGEFGITENLAVGIFLAQSSNGAYAGMQDYQITVKGQHNSLTYEGRIFISGEDSKDDNFFSGGNSFSLQVGYQFTEHWGALLGYLPTYKSTYDDGDDTDTIDIGAQTILSGHYEFHFGQHIMGLEAVYLHADGTDDNDDFDYSYFGPGIYANLKAAGFEFVPALRILASVEDRESSGGEEYTQTTALTQLNLMARKRF